MHRSTEGNADRSGPAAKGRGTSLRPPNRFERTHREDDFEQLDPADEQPAESAVKTVYLPDDSQSIVSENDSPDIPFRYSINLYRGCAHGCSYCYARPYHEYLGLNAGIDFESKVLVKHRGPELLRAWLARDAWRPEPIILSGVTDCYQPAEREFRLTRGCLEVAHEARQPIAIITKNALVTRDLDILRQMAADRTVSVALSITTLDAELARVMEPRTSTPAARLRAVRQLADAGVPVRVMVAPIIPGLNDFEMPAVLQAASEAGAQGAGYTLLRLPLAVRPIFVEWLERSQPLKAAKVQSLIRATRGGKLNSSQFGADARRGLDRPADQADFPGVCQALWPRRQESSARVPEFSPTNFDHRAIAAVLIGSRARISHRAWRSVRRQLAKTLGQHVAIGFGHLLSRGVDAVAAAYEFGSRIALCGFPRSGQCIENRIGQQLVVAIGNRPHGRALSEPVESTRGGDDSRRAGGQRPQHIETIGWPAVGKECQIGSLPQRKPVGTRVDLHLHNTSKSQPRGLSGPPGIWFAGAGNDRQRIDSGGLAARCGIDRDIDSVVDIRRSACHDDRLG